VTFRLAWALEDFSLAVSVFAPTVIPPTSPRNPPLAASHRIWFVTSLPLSVRLSWPSCAPAGALTSTSASPPLTNSGRDDSVLISRRAGDCECPTPKQVRLKRIAKPTIMLRRLDKTVFAINFISVSLFSEGKKPLCAAIQYGERQRPAPTRSSSLN